MKRLLPIAVIAVLAFGAQGANKPKNDINKHRHPNLAAAQRLVDQAWRKVSQAQEANEFDMAGHAAHAKELIEQANKELKEAAEAANKDVK